MTQKWAKKVKGHGFNRAKSDQKWYFSPRSGEKVKIAPKGTVKTERKIERKSKSARR